MTHITHNHLALSVALLPTLVLSAGIAPAAAAEGQARLTHPLLPGIRSAEVWNPEWPRVLHDKQLTGFSPLPLGMSKPPRVWSRIPTGGELNWVKEVKGRDGATFLLVNDGRLRRVSPEGKVAWSSSDSDPLIASGDIRGNGRDYLLLGQATRMALVDAETGKTEWRRTFDPVHAQVRVAVGDVLPDRPGLEAAVFLAYAEEGCLIQFPPAGEPQVVWKRTVIVPGEHPERYDHGCSIKLDFSDPVRPLIWNVRHHRCRCFDARTGEILASLVYPVGGGHRRNYGPWALGRGKGGRTLICVTAEQIQLHTHAIRRKPDGSLEMAWQHYYGEVYEKPGVGLQNVAMDDVDGDGETEMVYNVRDPAQGFRSFVRVRDADTGAIEVELPDHWSPGVFRDLGGEKCRGLLAFPAPNGSMPEQGRLEIHRFAASGRLEPLAEVEGASRWGPLLLPGEKGDDLLLRQVDSRGRVELVRYALREGRLQAVVRTRAGALLEAPIRALLGAPGGSFLVAGAGGSLQCVSWSGKRQWEIPLEGGGSPLVSAGDLTGDGRPELVAATADRRVRVYTFDRNGKARELFSREYLAQRDRCGPLLYDLEGKGRLCLVAPGSTPQGKVAVRAYRGDGSLLWERVLDMTTDDQGMVVAWNAGQFLPGPRSALAVSVANSRRAAEGTYLLDGPTGAVRWFKGIYRDGESIRAYRPIGIPTAFDYDGDGVEEIGMDLYSYMAFLRGTDASFATIRHTRNIREAGALYAGLLYNSFCPVYRSPEEARPHWFVPLGHGSMGLANPDPDGGVWRDELGYDMPAKAALVDVDGDGQLECGYAANASTAFRCRDLWTGKVKWEVALPSLSYGPTLAADVDGDGKGEFLAANSCVGTDAQGKGVIRWKSPVSFGWAAIADFDGDGKGEIACPSRGAISILKGE